MDARSPRRLIIVGALALCVASLFLNGLTLRHAARLNHDAHALVVARLLSLGALLRRHVEADGPGMAPKADQLHEWLLSDEASEIAALRILGRPGHAVFAWERQPGYVPFPADAWPEHGQRRRPFLEPNELRARDGARVFRGWMPLGPPGPPGPEGGPGPRGRVVVDLVPGAVLDLLHEGRLLVLGGVGVTAALWAALGLLIASERRRRRLQDELAAGERLAEVGRMAGVLAHQIRNPLAAIKGHAQLARERVDDAVVRRGLDHVVTESGRLEELATRLLRYVRPLQPQVARVDVAALFDELRRASPEAARADAVVSAPNVTADRVLLREALAALLDNALRAVAPEGRVRLVAETAEAEIVLAVDDDGPGIAAARRVEVVRPFGTGRPDGTGLGLPLAARIAEAHGGRLRIGESSLGGARVALVLPRGSLEGDPS